MTEQEIIDAGLIKTYVTKEESGDDNDYWYFTYDLADHIALISSDSDVSNQHWLVYLFESNIILSDIKDVIALIELFKALPKSNSYDVQR